MWNVAGTKRYWEEQTRKGNNPCHYHNKWQDMYAFKVRIKAFKKNDFKYLGRVVDIGCGIGEYTNAIAQKAPHVHFIGFDFPFNVEMAKKIHGDSNEIEFKSSPLPSREVDMAIMDADAVITTTVYVHLAEDAREALLSYVEKMKKGSKVMLLEYFPDKVPSFQIGLEHKEIETPVETVKRFKQHGFEISKIRVVNRVDSFLFHHLGTNFFTYWLTILSEWTLRIFPIVNPKYRLLIFEKS